MSLAPISTQPTIADLPNEMLEEIFSYLEFTERLVVSQVCRHWHGSALQWGDVRLSLCSSDKSIGERFLTSGRPYRHLEMNSDLLAEKLITKFGASLETIVLTNVESWDWLGSLGGLPHLRSLSIKCNYRYDALEDVPLVQPCPTFRWLTLEEIGSNAFPALNRFISATFPALVYLKVEYYSGIFRLSNLPKLQHLEMTGYNQIDDGLLQDFKTLPDLRTIILHGRRLECGYPDHVLRSDHIRTVQIGTDDPLDDDELLQLTEAFPGMTSFNFTRWSLCTVAGIDAARRKLPNCAFDVAPTEDSMELGSGSDGADSSSDTDGTDSS
ncbi:uncharacterized protein LOC6049753 [Culex quinquefasciatus]|uniref:uncharacterized protein LOC6049753 n=1 Tax=Culex quinquefasciatus TaxID=7176 RepID=UPI0018E2E94A|nr:uncharacterized protein LOC6049753 [Culex quinquefasciatus]